MMTTRWTAALVTGVLFSSACAAEHDTAAHARSELQVPAGDTVEITAQLRPSYLRVAGVAEPLREATLSTKLMGAVTEVLVQEGDVVRRGQPLLRIDARDLAAKAAQLDAAFGEAEAMYREAELHATRMRALFAEEAAPKAQLDAAETSLARARAALETVRAGGAELAATRSYAVVTAPFSGVVIRRMVDPGSFAAPGAPLLLIQDVSALRISASASPEHARAVSRGQSLNATVEGVPAVARVEGVVPSAGGNLYLVNAVVPNDGARLAAGGVATIDLPTAARNMIVIPRRAVLQQGELTGVYLQRDTAVLVRWIRLGPATGDSVEVLGGVQTGDRIIVPTHVAGSE